MDVVIVEGEREEKKIVKTTRYSVGREGGRGGVGGEQLLPHQKPETYTHRKEGFFVLLLRLYDKERV